MAAPGWNFAARDDEYYHLNGGPWAGLNGVIDAEDLGENWSSDTWNEPHQQPAADLASPQRPAGHSSLAPVFLSSPPQRVSEQQHRHDTSADATSRHHNADIRQPRHERLTNAAGDSSYHSSLRNLPPLHALGSSDFFAAIPQTSNPAQPSDLHTLQALNPGEASHARTPDPQAQETDHRAIETDSDDDAAMAPRRRREVVDQGPVDLTQSPDMATASASQQSRTRKRSSTSNSGDAGSAKKRTKRISLTSTKVDLEDLEDEAPSAEAELLQAQQREALKMQEDNKDEENMKIGKRTCIICLENYTNATIGVCGHIFCHECLTRALMASEKNNDRGKGNCPACRKAINRRNAKEVIPINFLKKSAMKDKGRQAHNR